MIRKNTTFNWCMFNTAVIILLGLFSITYHIWLKHEEHFWFVYYDWAKQQDRGAGRTCIEIKGSDFDIVVAEDAIKNKNKFDTLLIKNFIPISKKSFSLCIKQP